MKELNSAKVQITVLTPTYNRAYTLPKLYKSLERQTDKKFEWIVVDDGSNDNTKDLIASYQASDFPIRYYYKNNSGKHAAINLGMKYVNTEFTFIVDSDDYLCDDAIYLANMWISEIQNDYTFAGVAGVRVKDNEEHSLIGQYPNKCNMIDCLNSERKKYNLMGDKAEIYKTSLLKQNPFPEYQNEKFIPESVIWNRFALMGLKVRWHREALVVCEYLEDGLTSSAQSIAHFRDNFMGYLDDCNLNLKVLKFPFDISAGAVFFARCIAINRTTDFVKGLNIYGIRRTIIKLFGYVRFILKKY